jgi:phytoene dehydrogenase-like protein
VTDVLDAVVVGAGPNGLAAALTLAEAGRSVRVLEAATEPGGGARTAELTLPGYLHDVCSAVQGMTEVSPFLRALDLASMGVRLRKPEIAYAQPLDGGRAALAYADVDRTADGLGRDGRAWKTLFGPLVEHAPEMFAEVLGDLRHVPRHPFTMARFGLPGLAPVSALARTAFRDEPARALFAGVGAHSMRSLNVPLTSAFGLVLGTSAHVGGWPVVEGGSARLVDALVARLTELGVEIVCDTRVTALGQLPPARATLLDLGPKQLLAIGGDALPPAYRRTLQKFRYGPGVFKIDYALSGPVPWTNEAVRRAGTVHLGGTLAEVSASEADVEAGRHSEKPYVLVVQSTVADPTRAPAGHHTLWAYCHVPNGSTSDRTAAIEGQLERFAPGFRDLVLARATRTAAEYETYDNNYVGGDINAGRAGIYQSLLGPVPRWSRYRTAVDGLYLCSSSTPPGGGVHGMCGVHAAREALSRELATGASRVRTRTVFTPPAPALGSR